jgi:hypothetical protein
MSANGQATAVEQCSTGNHERYVDKAKRRLKKAGVYYTLDPNNHGSLQGAGSVARKLAISSSWAATSNNPSAFAANAAVPTDDSLETRREADMNNAVDIILNGISADDQDEFMGDAKVNPVACMETLEGLYGAKDAFAKSDRKAEFENIKLQKCKDVADYLRQKLRARVRFEAAGGVMSDEEFMADLLKKMGVKKFAMERKALVRELQTNPAAVTYIKVRNELLRAEKEEKEEVDVASDSDKETEQKKEPSAQITQFTQYDLEQVAQKAAQHALATSFQSGGGHGNNGNNGGGYGNNGGGYGGGGGGGYGNNGRGGYGGRGGRKRGRDEAGFNNRGGGGFNKRQGREERKCYNCGKAGHLANDCRD